MDGQASFTVIITNNYCPGLNFVNRGSYMSALVLLNL